MLEEIVPSSLTNLDRAEGIGGPGRLGGGGLEVDGDVAVAGGRAGAVVAGQPVLDAQHPRVAVGRDGAKAGGEVGGRGEGDGLAAKVHQTGHVLRAHRCVQAGGRASQPGSDSDLSGLSRRTAACVTLAPQQNEIKLSHARVCESLNGAQRASE